MILDSIIYMPMHYMHSTGDDKIVIALGIAITILSLISYLLGFLYDGIKNKDWSWFNVYSNLAKSIGGLFFCFMVTLWITGALVREIYKYL